MVGAKKMLVDKSWRVWSFLWCEFKSHFGRHFSGSLQIRHPWVFAFLLERDSGFLYGNLMRFYSYLNIWTIVFAYMVKANLRHVAFWPKNRTIKKKKKSWFSQTIVRFNKEDNWQRLVSAFLEKSSRFW